MRIQIDIPEIECVRCSKQGVRQPTMLQMISENGSAATTTIRDSRGNYWKAAMAKLPAGWETIGIDQKVICADCVKAWHETEGQFFSHEPPSIPERVLSWPEQEAMGRAQGGRKVTIGGVIPTAPACSIVKADVPSSRGSNIPQLVAMPTSGHHMMRATVRSQSGAAMPPAATSPTPPPATAAPSPRPNFSTMISISSTPAPEQRVARATANMSVINSGPGLRTIPLPSENTRQPVVTGTAALSGNALRADPAPLPIEPAVGLRCDRVVDAKTTANYGDAVVGDEIEAAELETLLGTEGTRQT